MTKLEEVARAIWSNPDYNRLLYAEERRDGSWHDCIPLARAAIAAMRVPDTAMDRAGNAIECGTSGNYLEAWQTMIDAALSEPIINSSNR